MCGRFTLTAGQDDITSKFLVDAHAVIPPRYNVAPTQPVLIVRHTPKGVRELAAAEWGLVPEWAKKRHRGKPLINARMETVESKASFRSAVKRTRCLMPFTGWYEWRTEKGKKQPYLIKPIDDQVHGFAAIWTVWHGPDGEHWLETVTIVTAEATDHLRGVHHRKPLVVAPESYEQWLTPQDPLPRNFWQSISFLSERSFDYFPVNDRVNNIRNDDSSCIAAPPPSAQASFWD